MTAQELCNLDLLEVSQQIRKRKVSSLEVTRAMLDRIERLDGKLRSYATVTPEVALEAAAQADREIAKGKNRGPLHGVPIALKDLFHTKGIATAAGMPMHRNFIPERDATVVRKLKEAGAVLLGKLQMTEGAFSAHHPAIRSPVNPWSAAHWTGVSSSGSGVATAAGLCYGSLGTDTLGSIRFPSTMNGLTGMKPTWGRVSRAGVFPLAETMDHVGPMTRSAKDAAAMLKVIAGQVAALFDSVDLLLLPAMNEAAPTMAQLYERRNDMEARYRRIRFTSPFNMTGSPSLTLPGGATREGIPIGFQLVGRHLDEALIFRAGHAYQRATQWHLRRPPES